jgi:SAM-dependent methyltransferase
MVTQEIKTTKPDALLAYDAVAPHYEEYSKTKGAYLSAVENLVISKLKPHFRLLDVGAGDGRRLAIIKDRVGLTDITAIEPSKEMAKICREKAQVPVIEIFAEKINELDIGSFDVVTALWNVFGHIPSSGARLQSLKNMAGKLKKDGIIILDVNNRHNALAYGRFKVFMRTIVDGLWFKESRGDTSYDWKIGNQTFKSSGHLFTPAEIEGLFTEAGLKIVERFSLNYMTGELSTSKFRGQLFYVLTHR